jgi:hypothetical protein
MENILKILNRLTGQLSFLGSIPKPIKATLSVFAVFVGVLVIFKYTKLDQTEKTFLIVAIVLLAVITGGYYAWKAWMEKQHNSQFGGEISQHSSATPRGMSDPGQRARLDDLRKKFQSGVDAYKSRGKDLYKLPWYVIVGEPGSGKTEAVRHSNVGFPPGMQDEFQGVGGTINMNWWFTNHAVLLDTAGRLMFEELKPGETSEWKEFLTLLKKNRPNCPINGLFLVIPSDSLIKDSADSIQKKAGKIAQQLDVIQRVLDVRFPVFVVVTKCDKINGFREFFDGLTDPQLQHQMMGWSNPDQLDEPFKPEMVDKHLEQVVSRLRRRRLGLLRDPVPENTEGRRTDEVDSLYALPHSLEMISSRLRRYLETIFIAGEWSAKPLFLRGIYFSSSMREGAALDAELAEAIGVGVDELPEGKVWERERAYFLRDLFIEKVFREKGLVTRATNTKRMLRGQQIALYAVGFAALVIFSSVAWFAMGDLRSGVKDQGDYWHVVSVAGWDNKYWKDSLVPMRGDGSFMSALTTNRLTIDNKAITLGEFHAKLMDLAQKPLKKNMMFPGLADKYNQNSHRAQRIVFEAGVVRPLIDATRQKMSRDESDPGSAQREPDALATLIQLEADVLTRGTTPTNNGTVTPETARRFLGSLESYIAGQEVIPDTNLVSVMVWTYGTNDTAKNSWAPRYLSGGRGGTNTLAVNTGINAGLEAFVRNATNELQAHISEWDQISSLHHAVRLFTTYEETLFAAAKSGLDDKFSKDEEAVEKARKDLDAAIETASRSPLFTNGVLLTGAQKAFHQEITSSAAAALGRIREVNGAALAATKDYPLFKEIKIRLDGVQTVLSNRVTELLASGDAKEFQTLDENSLAENSFRKRAEFYSRVKKLMDENPFTGDKLKFGVRGEPLEKALNEGLNAIRTEAAGYHGRLTNEFVPTLAYELKLAEKKMSEKYFDAYLAKADVIVGFGIGFPLVKDLTRPAKIDDFTTAGKNLKFISSDLASPVFQKYAPQDSEKWKRFVAKVAEQQMIAKALMGDEGILGSCIISLAASSDATRADDEWQGTWRDLKLVFEGGNNEAVRAGAETDQKLGDAPVAQKIELRILKNVNDPASPKFVIATSDWGPLELIHKYKSERDKTDPKTWLVRLPVGAPGAKGFVRLKLKFENPLPDLDRWPTL